MPKVGGKSFPYTKKGMADAAKAKKMKGKSGYMGGGMAKKKVAKKKK